MKKKYKHMLMCRGKALQINFCVQALTMSPCHSVHMSVSVHLFDVMRR